MDDVKKALNGSFFLLHACAHNPTLVDSTKKQIEYFMLMEGVMSWILERR